MNPYFEITEQNILFRGVIYEHEYIIYCINNSVSINTEYRMIGKGLYSAAFIMTENYVTRFRNLTEWTKMR